MRNAKIKDLVFCSIIIGLIIVMTFTNLGFLTLGGIAVTLVHVPVLIGAIILGKKYGAILGLTFGICSMILSFANIATNAPFTNPIVSVLPRVLFGFMIYPIYTVFVKLFKNKIVSNAVTMVVCTLLHTVIVLTLVVIAWKTNFYFGVDDFVASSGSAPNLFSFIYAVFITNGIIEVIIAGLVGTPISIALNIVIHRNDANVSIEEK